MYIQLCKLNNAKKKLPYIQVYRRNTAEQINEDS